MIMIGPGTGIAPFRAFMQQRAADGAQGKNWLFFGNPHFTEDFLYQVEWQSYVKEGLLTRIDLARSRDQQQKIYVQDKLREQGPSCGAGSMTAPTFMSAATPIAWRRTWKTPYWK
nr:Sulfite reductase [NADPH] flavoprotein alpha-component [Klebsiella pneumoniae]